MGAIAAAVNKKGKDVVPHVVAMLKQLTHRGADAHGIATSGSVRVSNSLDKLSTEEINCAHALGYNFSCMLPRDCPQPILGNGWSLVFEGRGLPLGIPGHACPRAHLELSEMQVRNIMRRINGPYAFAIALSDKVIAGRDSVGVNSLYYAEDDLMCAIASERKALWHIGMKNVRSFPIGNLATIDASGLTFQTVKTIAQPLVRALDMKTAAKHLRKLLLASTMKRAAGIDEVAVAFSGGLDSSVIAVLAKLCKAPIHLISVGLEKHFRVQSVELAAKALELPLTVETYTLSDVKRVLPKILWLIEVPSPVKASIAIPLYWVAQIASRMKSRVLFAGQGSDELFGGYQRYLKKYAESQNALRTTMYSDIAVAYETNFQRDIQVCSFHKVDLRLPFADAEVVKFAASLPINLKIQSSCDPLRKRVLRQVARNLGIPAFIVNKRKKAIQYTTGVQKAIKRLAKRERLDLSRFFSRIFQKVYPTRV